MWPTSPPGSTACPCPEPHRRFNLRQIKAECRGPGREAFAKELADLLDPQARDGEFERLVLAAPPRLLRAIREKLSRATRSRIQAEIPKDLLKVSNHDIKAWLHAPGLL